MPVWLDLDQAEVGRGVAAESLGVIRKRIDIVSRLGKLTNDAAFACAGDTGEQEERLGANRCEVGLLFILTTLVTFRLPPNLSKKNSLSLGSQLR